MVVVHDGQTSPWPASSASRARPEDIGGGGAVETVLGALVRGVGNSPSGAERFGLDAAGAFGSVEAEVGTDADGARDGRIRSRPNPRADVGTGFSCASVSTGRDGKYFGMASMPSILSAKSFGVSSWQSSS